RLQEPVLPGARHGCRQVSRTTPDMNWDDLVDRMRQAGLDPREETYMEHYGKVLSAQRSEFRDRIIRCTYGKVLFGESSLEVFLFPSEGHLQDFVEVSGEDASWGSLENALFRVQTSDPSLARRIVQAISKPPY